MKVQVFLAVLASMTYAAMALSCKSCMQFDMGSDNENLQPMIDMMKGMGNVNCKDNAGDSSIQDTPCGAAPRGQKAVCARAAITTKYNMPDANVNLNMNMYMRMCHVVPSEQQAGCDDISQYEDTIRQSMGAQAAMLGGLDGNMCFCEANNCNDAQISVDEPKPVDDKDSDDSKAEGNKDTDSDSNKKKENAAAAPAVLISSLFLLLVHLL